MEKIAELLGVFVEKHLIPTVVSVGTSIAICAITPKDFFVIERLGIICHGALVFCIAFLIIEGLIYLFRTIKSHNNRVKEDEIMEEFWTFTDKLSADDRDCLRKYLETNNAPIESNVSYLGFCLFNSNCVDVTTVNKSRSIQNDISTKPNKKTIVEYSAILPVKQYKLKTKFYGLLKYSYEKYGKISHFE